MFCTSLRNRSLWAQIIPSLSTHPQLNLRETNLSTHDVALPILQSRSSQSIHLRFLLLSASTLQATTHQETLSRVERLSTLTGGRDVAVVFMLRESSSPSANIDGMHAYMDFQLLLFNMQMSIPILPLHDVVSLPTMLLTYHSSSKTASPSVPPPNTAEALLPHCTTSAPYELLSEHSTNVLTDICSALGDLAAAAGTDEGKMQIKEYLDDGQVRGNTDAEGVIHFWEEEWIAE